VLAAAALQWRLHPFARKTQTYCEYQVEMRQLGRSLHERGWLVSLDTVPVEAGATGDIIEVNWISNDFAGETFRQ